MEEKLSEAGISLKIQEKHNMVLIARKESKKSSNVESAFFSVEFFSFLSCKKLLIFQVLNPKPFNFSKLKFKKLS